MEQRESVDSTKLVMLAGQVVASAALIALILILFVWAFAHKQALLAGLDVVQQKMKWLISGGGTFWSATIMGAVYTIILLWSVVVLIKFYEVLSRTQVRIFVCLLLAACACWFASASVLWSYHPFSDNWVVHAVLLFVHLPVALVGFVLPSYFIAVSDLRDAAHAAD